PAAWADITQGLLVLLAVAFCCRGAGSLRYGVLLGLALPALRYALSPAYRCRVRAWFARLRTDLAAYPAGGKTPWLATLVFVTVPVVAFLAWTPETVGGDSQPVMLTTVRLVTHGDCDLSEYGVGSPVYQLFGPGRFGPLPYFLERTRTGIYPHYPSGMVAFALPVAAAARCLGARLDDLTVRARLEKWTACWVCGGCLGLFFLLALHLAPPRPVWALTAILATGSVFSTTIGQLLWQHGGVIFWGLLALLIEFRRTSRPFRGATVLQGAACALMGACRLSSAVFVVPFGAWVLLREPRRALALAACALLFYLPWAGLYWSMYGNFFGPSTGQMALGKWTHGHFALAGVLFSPARGVFVYQPWLLLGAAALLPAVRRRLPASRAPCPAGWPLFCAAVIVLQLAVVSAWSMWWGGICWGSRLASEIIPLAALLCVRPVAGLWAYRPGRGIILALALLSALLHAPYLHGRAGEWAGHCDLNIHRDLLWSWSDPPFLYPLLHGRR
ncbi:MAG TPA: hypothetical protein VJ739_14810, partial [Gemmataceae bacterium]|nr:hypothetical protein [Gemmataceae bacterium]